MRSRTSYLFNAYRSSSSEEFSRLLAHAQFVPFAVGSPEISEIKEIRTKRLPKSTTEISFMAVSAFIRLR